jgi:protein arginine N-methyltransferase 1
VDTVNEEAVITNECLLKEVNLYTVTKADLDFTTQYSLSMMTDDKVHAVVVWFDIEFGNLENPVTFSTGPFSKFTHWKQTIFYLQNSLIGKVGDLL